MSWRERYLFLRFSPSLNFSDTDDISKNPSCGQNLRGQWQMGQKREVLFQDILGCVMWCPRNISWLLQILLTGAGGWEIPSFLATPLGGCGNWVLVKQPISLDSGQILLDLGYFYFGRLSVKPMGNSSRFLLAKSCLKTQKDVMQRDPW